jgi:hypothetical protein
MDRSVDDKAMALLPKPRTIFKVDAGGAPVEVVAALFHDGVHVQVNSGFHINLTRYLLKSVGPAWSCSNKHGDSWPENPVARLCMSHAPPGGVQGLRCAVVEVFVRLAELLKVT